MGQFRHDVHLSGNASFLSFFLLRHSYSSGINYHFKRIFSINSKPLGGLREEYFGAYLGRMIVLVVISFWKLKVS